LKAEQSVRVSIGLGAVGASATYRTQRRDHLALFELGRIVAADECESADDLFAVVRARRIVVLFNVVFEVDRRGFSNDHRPRGPAGWGAIVPSKASLNGLAIAEIRHLPAAASSRLTQGSVFPRLSGSSEQLFEADAACAAAPASTGAAEPHAMSHKPARTAVAKRALCCMAAPSHAACRSVSRELHQRFAARFVKLKRATTEHANAGSTTNGLAVPAPSLAGW